MTPLSFAEFALKDYECDKEATGHTRHRMATTIDVVRYAVMDDDLRGRGRSRFVQDKCAFWIVPRVPVARGTTAQPSIGWLVCSCSAGDEAHERFLMSSPISFGSVEPDDL